MTQDTALFVVLAVTAMIFVTSLYVLHRNNWVYNQRMRLIHEDWDSYQRLPSYDDMMKKFWIWDVKKFYE